MLRYLYLLGEIRLLMKDSLYYKELTFENILNSYKLVKKICRNKNKIKDYDLNLYTNIHSLLDKLIKNEYRPMPYTIFTINKNKVRIVMAQEITDKIVNHFVTKYYLNPLLDKKLISQNVANRENMGLSYLYKLMRDYLNILNRKKKDIYALKLDVYNYFYSINTSILLNMLSSDIRDDNIINLVKIILNETNKEYVFNKVKYLNSKYNMDIPIYSKNKGISIGSMTSQFFGIYYLNKLDHFIKEELHCKYYLRYQDDVVLLSYDKNKLKIWWNLINNEINKIDLKLNKKSNIYKLSNGLNYVGINYRIINNKLVIKPCSIYKINRKLRKYDNYYKKLKSLASYNGYFKRFNIWGGSSFKMDVSKVYEDLKKNIVII